MSLLQAIFLGVVQGITEFLPVSSSGHLAIFQNIFGMQTDGGLLFDVCLHIGTLAAVFIVYWKDIFKMIREFFSMCADIAGSSMMCDVNFLPNKAPLSISTVPNCAASVS